MALCATLGLIPLPISDRMSVSSSDLFTGEQPPGLLLAVRHGLGYDLVQLVGRIAQSTQHRIRCVRGCWRRLWDLAEVKPQQPDSLGDSVLFRSEMPAVDFGPQEALQIVRQIDRHGV